MAKSREEQSEAFLNSDTVGDDFFSSIVENQLNIKRDKFKIRLVMLSPATGKNDNFVSIVYRAKIKIEILETNERQSIDAIVKALLSTLKEFKEFSVFPRERFMYEDVITNYEKLWLESTNEVVQFAPKCLKIETDPYEIMVFDDLKANDYQMLDRKVGLTAAQTKSALTKLAKFHAASAVRYHQDGTLRDFLVRKSMMSTEMMASDGPLAKSFDGIFTHFIECLKLYGDCDKFVDKISRWDKKKLRNCWLDVAEPMRCGLIVLAHGDFWLNNMMFKLNESNEPEDTLLLDFQACAWASPNLDLHYFITSSVHDDVKVKCYDEFIKHYHEELSESLKKLSYDKHIPTLEEMYDDLLEKAAMALQSTLFIMFVTKYDSTDEINMEVIFTEGTQIGMEFYKKIYCNDNFKKALKLWLHFFEERGYMDALLPDDQMSSARIANGN